jgi:hypothetical protein
MRARKIRARLKIWPDGTLLYGSKDPQFEGDLSPEDFKAKLDDLAEFVAGQVKGLGVDHPKPEVQLSLLPFRESFRVSLGLSGNKGFGSTVKLHHAAEIESWLLHYGNYSNERGYKLDKACCGVQPVLLVYGGWPDGDTVGVGCESGVDIHVGLHVITAEYIPMLTEALAEKFNQSRYYIETGGEIAVFERVRDKISSQ